MSRKKILIISQNGLSKGGVQTVIMNVVRNLHDYFDFDVLVLRDNVKGYYDDEFLSYGGHIFKPNLFQRNASRLKTLFNKIKYVINGDKVIRKVIIENGPYDVVHCHNGIYSATALKVAAKMNIGNRVTQGHIVFDDSDSSFISKLKNKRLSKILHRCATDKIACSDKAARSIFGSKHKFTVILNPYDNTKFDKYLYPEPSFDTPVLIQIGNYSTLKNQVYSLHVLKELTKTYPSAKLRLIGFDVAGQETVIRNTIKELGLENNVEMYPSDADSPKLLSTSSYMLLPSRTEAFGIVLIEAQSMGLRCFVSDVTPQEANAGGCTYLSIQSDPKVWADEIAKDFSETQGKHGDYDCSKYEGKNIALKYKEIYNMDF